MFQINKTLLQVVTTRDNWFKLRKSIPMDRFDKEVRVVLNAVKKYWSQYDTPEMNMEVFTSKFWLEHTLDDSERELYRRIFEIMAEEPDDEVAREIIRDLRLMEFHKELENASNEFVLGSDIDLYETVRGHVNEFEADVRRSADTGYCDASVEDIIRDEDAGSCLPWGLRCLRQSMPKLRTGMQVIVAARPGRGKTSFIASNVMHMVQSDFIQDTLRPIVWFNNEGKKIRIKGNCLRAGLRKTIDEIRDIGYNEAQAEFERVLGRPDLLRVYDIHGKDYMYLERIIENDKPAVVVFDMLDNVRGFQGRKGADRADQRLEALYQWARESAVKYDFLSLPTSQISVEGDNQQWVSDSCLKDSKTAKQGACDAIITIGSISKTGYERSRFIYIPKTKFVPEMGHPADCRTEVVFDGARSLYLDPKQV